MMPMKDTGGCLESITLWLKLRKFIIKYKGTGSNPPINDIKS